MPGTSQKKEINILLVEDNLVDSDLMLEVMKLIGVDIQISIVNNGIDALEYLYKTGRFFSSRTPDLILLDLNLPKKDGREVLAEIKGNTRLKMIPVVVLSTSDAQTDIRTCYSLQANCYIKKPVDLDGFIKITTDIMDFWFSTVQIPRIDD